ncbi:MAG: hypothetical protein IT434_11910 [Phycisphaerales bacterium]|jgi:hypothetical protein|nr:hypothetical protein [Phycisphaerales bacterium]
MFVDFDPNDHESLRLSPEDVARCDAIIDAAGRQSDPRAQRHAAFLDLMRLVDADDWLWAYSAAEEGELRPTNLDHQYFGARSARQRAIYLQRVFCWYEVPFENFVIHKTLLSCECATFSEHCVLSDKWWNSEERRTYAARSGFDDVMYSKWLVKVENEMRCFSGVTLWRRTGRPPFTYRDSAVVHRVVGLIPACNGEGRNRSSLRVLGALTPAMRPALALYLCGNEVAEIVRAVSKSEDTIRGRLKSIAKLVTGTSSLKSLRHELGFGDHHSRSGTA